MISTSIKRLALSLALLIGASLILLLSDLHSRKPVGAPNAADSQTVKPKYRVAVLKHISNALLDETEQGILDQLSASGFADGQRASIQRFCAEGDLPTENDIAKRITSGDFDMAITVSTLSLQCVANANKDGRVIHVFGAVTDPSSAGVGIQKMNSTNKPAWLAGLGTFQPVEQIFRAAKRLNPNLKVVGVVWNPAESNSEICTGKAREACKALGMQLIEATVDQSKDVREAAASLVARGAQAFWTGADATVQNATTALTDVAIKAKIPVFSNSSGQVKEGTLFDLGANYHEVGMSVGAMAVSIMEGRNPAGILITNFMPERISLNLQVSKKMRDSWQFPDEFNQRAELILDENGKVKKGEFQNRKMAVTTTQPSPAHATTPAKKWRLTQVIYTESPMVEQAVEGFAKGLEESGLKTNTDYVMQTISAQGDMAALSGLFESAGASGTDLYVVYGTPTLQMALRKVPVTPVVFTVVADPFVIGAGKTDNQHATNITGVYTQGPYREIAEMIQTHFPKFKRVGTLFCPAEANSVANKEVFTKEAAKYGIEVVAVAANTAGDLPDAAMSLCEKRVDALVQVIDNLSAAGFPAISRAAQTAKLPLFACQGSNAKQGACLVMARDYLDAGRETAAKAARVIKGESPAQIPFSPPSKTKKLVNLKNAAACGLEIPNDLLKDMQQVNTP